jgi:hypothetical protein
VYVISLVKLRKKFGLFLLVLVGLVLLGFVLPRAIAIVARWLAPAAGWLKATFLAAVDWTRGVLVGLGGRLEPFVETLKEYYRGN